MQHASLIPSLLEIACHAGQVIMQHYDGEVEVEIKEDASPVTIADLEANAYIVEQLQQLAPEITIISEEESGIRNQESGKRDSFFLVDPLDGTKSFIKRTGEFTVNIGLIEKGNPVLGVIYAPAQKVLYWGVVGEGAYKKFRDWSEVSEKEEQRDKGKEQRSDSDKISTRTPPPEGLTVIASKSHRTVETDAFIDTLNVKEFIAASSSLKLCLLAEGAADCYPRFGPTMEWDTAAGDAILRAAGGRVITPEGTTFIYGKEDFRNGHFIAWGGKKS